MNPQQNPEEDSISKSSKAGQIIGNAFESVVINFITHYIEANYEAYELLQPEEGGKLVKLEMLGGTLRQLDTVIVSKNSFDPIALLETKWLKDARHHNDKGAWILQLREVRKRYPTVRGAVAILAGYWTEGVGVVFMSEAGVRMVLVASDEEIYGTLQQPLNEFLGDESFILDVRKMRQRYERPGDFARFLIHLQDEKRLQYIATSWLDFERERNEQSIITGKDLIRKAIDEILAPLPSNPRIKDLEIALQIDTGNTIYQKFDDVESALEFIQSYFNNPEAILRRISPQPGTHLSTGNEES
ncbi:MAG TPA: hypothetical protein VHD90_05860 [Phototrophicaceae bacterium]|nr:hypothetical protein [Phototrophicaceae bacterium]